jgi:hypothetical protein
MYERPPALGNLFFGDELPIRRSYQPRPSH